MFEYTGILFTFLVAGAVALLLMGLHVLLGPKRPTPEKSEVFECGKEPIGLPEGQSSVHFYVLSMLFIVFDVEMVFLFPWAVTFREMGLFGLLEMGFFLGFVVLGYLYAWRKGALDVGVSRDV